MPRFRELQIMLASLGFYFGDIDDIFGPKTEASIRAFQKAQGLNADGIIEALKSGNSSTIKVAIRQLMVQGQLNNLPSALPTEFSRESSQTDNRLFKSAA